MKKYKHSSPTDTVLRIRKALNEIGVITKDLHYGKHPFYSCRIIIGNENLSTLSIGTNGKGRSFEYSLASGYAEFMERLQNSILLPEKRYATKRFLKDLNQTSEYVQKLLKNNLALDYIYDKDEEYWGIDQLIKTSLGDLKKLLCIDTDKEIVNFLHRWYPNDEFVMAPFYSVEKGKQVMLPIEILLSVTASNGMCAGNTKEEALVQGFCEIFERYVAKQIYYNEICPPTIPFEYFASTPVYEELLFLKNNSQFDIYIKDCSLGLGFPVIGVLFIDKTNSSYNFKLGSDFLPHIALERCLTEIHQGVDSVQTLPFTFFDKNTSNEQIENYFDHNFQKIAIDHSGFWPVSLFENQSTYSFSSFDNSYGLSDESDLRICIDLITKLGYNIYIRDNSVLDFPAYYIVIPGFSELIGRKEIYRLFKSNFRNISFARMSSITFDDAKLMAESINDNYYLIKYYGASNSRYLLYNTDEYLLNMDLEILAFMLFYYISDIKNAKKYMQMFLYSKSRELYAYYYAIYDYIVLLYDENKDERYIRAVLEKIYGESIINEVFEDMSNRQELFRYHQFPNCFNCESCTVKQSCLYENILRIQVKINEFNEKSKIDQSAVL